jgi:hypothetical protein
MLKIIFNLPQAKREKYRQTLDDACGLNNITLTVTHHPALHHESKENP